MTMKIWMAGMIALASASAGLAQDAPLPDDQAAMKAHVLFLASDALRGREAGSPEYRIAAEYVAAQFFAAGLKPAGDAGSYIQKVPLVTYRAADKTLTDAEVNTAHTKIVEALKGQLHATLRE